MNYLLRGNDIISKSESMDDIYKVKKMVESQAKDPLWVVEVGDDDIADIKKDGNKIIGSYDVTYGWNGELEFSEISYPIDRYEDYDGDDDGGQGIILTKYFCGYCGKHLMRSEIALSRCPRCNKLMGASRL